MLPPCQAKCYLFNLPCQGIAKNIEAGIKQTIMPTELQNGFPKVVSESCCNPDTTENYTPFTVVELLRQLGSTFLYSIHSGSHNVLFAGLFTVTRYHTVDVSHFPMDPFPSAAGCSIHQQLPRLAL